VPLDCDHTICNSPAFEVLISFSALWRVKA